MSNRGLDESTVRSAVEVKAQIFNEVTDQAWGCWDELGTNGCVVTSSDPVLNSAKSSGNRTLLPHQLSLKLFEKLDRDCRFGGKALLNGTQNGEVAGNLFRAFLKTTDFLLLGEFREDNLIDVGRNTFNA